ncbi:hypothetical protein ASPSYDRAFT_136297 [Aspergillus sydowii CBS 593.65]|uniref:Aminotransferase class I/classII large domain-containing protein n=1 Tax=Aspergillus sydowii CBS 593.65 TaxID=1036612 RepID=A0A1L9T427_9EURO|nr:uncharacterized protein ASPSYDRAFT_136297 [Aspergillus sydowii CBS 593.65]OJJ54168.1 hypothetical protein ASPSYDRAFT_136297 [Aspergillus sydowii CBS 593.65]
MEPPLDLATVHPDTVRDPIDPAERIYAREMGYPETAAQVAVNHVSAMAEVEYNADRNCLIAEPGGSLRAVLQTFLRRPDDEVILTDPASRALIDTVKAANANPVLAPLVFLPGQKWVIRHRAFQDCVTDRTKAILLQSPCMPSGVLFSKDDWGFIGRLCKTADLLLLFDTSFDTVIYNFTRPMWSHPASAPGMADRTVMIGTGSGHLEEKLQKFEYVVGPEKLISDLRPFVWSKPDHFTFCQVDSFQFARGPLMAAARQRRNIVINALRGFPIGIPDGGWSLLLETSDYGLTAQQATARLAEQGIKVTPMDGWGRVHGEYFVRIVFAHQPAPRLATLRERFVKAFRT